MDLDEALARLDQQNWARIAHRVSAETGMDISPEQARELSRREITALYGEAPHVQ